MLAIIFPSRRFPMLTFFPTRPERNPGTLGFRKRACPLSWITKFHHNCNFNICFGGLVSPSIHLTGFIAQRSTPQHWNSMVRWRVHIWESGHRLAINARWSILSPTMETHLRNHRTEKWIIRKCSFGNIVFSMLWHISIPSKVFVSFSGSWTESAKKVSNINWHTKKKTRRITLKIYKWIRIAGGCRSDDRKCSPAETSGLMQGLESEWGGVGRDSFNWIEKSRISISCFLKNIDPIFKLLKIS